MFADGHALQLVMTASTLYEAVEPRIVWRKLFEPLISEITGDGTRHEVNLPLGCPQCALC